MKCFERKFSALLSLLRKGEEFYMSFKGFGGVLGRLQCGSLYLMYYVCMKGDSVHSIRQLGV